MVKNVYLIPFNYLMIFLQVSPIFLVSHLSFVCVHDLDYLFPKIYYLSIAANSSDQTTDQDLLTHLLKNLANLTGSTTERNPTGLLPVSQDSQNAGTSLGTALKVLHIGQKFLNLSFVFLFFF